MSDAVSRALTRSAQLLDEIEARYPNPSLLLVLRLRYLRYLFRCCSGDTRRRHWNFAGYDITRKLLAMPTFDFNVAIQPAEILTFQSICARLTELPTPRFAKAASTFDTAHLSDLLQCAARRLENVVEESWNGTCGAALDGWSVVRVPLVLPPRHLGPDGGGEEWPEVDPVLGRIRMGTTIELQMRAERIGPFTRGPLLHLDAPADTSLQTQLHTILEILCQHPPGKQHPDRRVVFQARWSLPGGRVDGLSIGLPFYLAAWAALADRRSSTNSRFLAPYLAATGCVQGGEVLPVNGDTLASKVEAAFFAPVLRLMVPEVQKKEAVAEVHRLRASHPGRQLVILGVRELPRGEEFPGMVVTRQRRPREVAGRLLREWMVHGGVATITALLAALSAAVIVLFFWVTKNEPIDAAWSDEHLTTTNRHGRIVGKFPFPPGKPVGWQGGRFASRSTYIANLDHEGKNEILTFLWDRNQKADRLAAIDRHGRLIWVRRAGTLDDRVVDAWEDQNWSDLLVFPDPLLPQQILTIRRSITGPLSVLASIDPRSGKALGILQNAGHLEDLYAVELPEVESGLVLAVGTHNPSRSGIAILFDPAGFCVESAERLPWSTDSTQVGTRPWSAILMPPDVFTSGTRVSACDVGRERDGLLRIAVRGESRGDVNYYFEIGAFRRIGLRAVQITDGYKQKLRESGSGLDESDFHNEEERLLRGTRWLTPTGWHDFDPDRRQNGKPQ